MANYRLFVACSFQDERFDLRNYIIQQVEAQGSFVPILGNLPDGAHGPAQKVRDLIETCNAAMIIETADREGCATPWIYSEIGMAYQEHLPIFALVDKHVQDTGLTKYAVSYESFDPSKFTESRLVIWKGLQHLEALLIQMGSAILTPENMVKKSLVELLPRMIIALEDTGTLDIGLSDALKNAFQDALRNVTDREGATYSDSDEFAKKLVTARAAKLRIAEYVYKRFLKDMEDSDQEVALDSGTVTFTICEKLVRETCRVPLVTNNIAVGRHLSEVPHYPCFILPGKLESRYLASLGPETDSYFLERLKQGHIASGIIAATSFSSAHGIGGNDPRHASFKKLLLENCPTAVLVFEGEKIIQEIGNPVYSPKEWNNILAEREGKIYIITHRPEHWENLNEVKRNLYDRTIADLKQKLGQDRVIALPDDEARGVERSPAASVPVTHHKR